MKLQAFNKNCPPTVTNLIRGRITAALNQLVGSGLGRGSHEEHERAI